MENIDKNFYNEAIATAKWIENYLNNLEQYPILPDVKPNQIKKSIGDIPENSLEYSKIIEEFEKKILPGITHWNHPNFMALFNSTTSTPGILGEFITAAINANGFLWLTSPALTELELRVLEWFRDALGLSSKYFGIIYDTASTSTFHAICAAREYKGDNVRERGLFNQKPMRIYCSENAHSSVDKGVIAAGLGLNSLRKVSCDDDYKMNTAELEMIIKEDIEAGYLPICVIGTIGTTSTTSIDPVKEIREICNKYNIWFHVDSAYAGVTSMLEEKRGLFHNFGDADSIVINPHKWLFTPVDFSAFFTSKKEYLRKAFSLTPEYLKTDTEEEAINLMDYGYQLGRRFRALKFWLIFKYYGLNGLKTILRNHLDLAQHTKKELQKEKHFEIISQVNFSTVCFRLKKDGLSEEELTDLNTELLKRINKSNFYLSHTKLQGKYIIRLVVSGIRTQEDHVNRVLKIIKEEASKLL